MTNLNYTMGKKNNRNNSGNSSQQRSARNNHTMGKKDNRNNGQSFFSKAPNTLWRSSGVSTTSSNGGVGRNNPSSHPSDRSQFEKSPIPKDSLVELMAEQRVEQRMIVKGVITEVYPEAFAYALSDHTSTIRVEIRPDDAKKADDNENRLEVGTRVQLMVKRENKIDFICCSSEDSCKILGNVLLENDHLEKDRALVSSDSVDPSTMLVEGCGLLIYVKPLSSFILIKGYPHEVGALYYAARYDKIREDLVEEQMSRLPVGMITNLEESIDKKYNNSALNQWMKAQKELLISKKRPHARTLYSVACPESVLPDQLQPVTRTIEERLKRYTALDQWIKQQVWRWHEKELYLSRFEELIQVEKESSPTPENSTCPLGDKLVRRCMMLVIEEVIDDNGFQELIDHTERFPFMQGYEIVEREKLAGYVGSKNAMRIEDFLRQNVYRKQMIVTKC